MVDSLFITQHFLATMMRSLYLLEPKNSECYLTTFINSEFLTTLPPWLTSLLNVAILLLYLHLFRIKSVSLIYCPKSQGIFCWF